jgi:glycosyltransferase involved in cell wall biosynthesis
MNLLKVRALNADGALSSGPGPISLFSPSLAGGGAERVLLNLARGLRALGHEVDVVLVKAKGELLSQLPADLNVIDLDAKWTIASLLPLARYIKRRRPAGIIAFLDHANVVAFWACILARRRTPLVATVHGTWSRILEEGNYKTRILARVIGHTYKKMDKVVAVSEGVAVDLIETLGLCSSTVKIIYNPVVVPELWQKAAEPVDHQWFGPGQPPVIVAVGRLTKQKDFSTLIQAFFKVRKAYQCRLMILGEGRDRPYLEQLVKSLNIESEVSMPGFVLNPYKYMSRSSLFVLSSNWEGLPTVLVEALALGVPVVSTDCESGPREILKNGELGTLTPVGDTASMSAHILQSLSTARPCPINSSVTDYEYLNVARKYDQLLMKSNAEYGVNASLLDSLAEL